MEMMRKVTVAQLGAIGLTQVDMAVNGAERMPNVKSSPASTATGLIGLVMLSAPPAFRPRSPSRSRPCR